MDLSIIIPNYNYAHYLEQAIVSVATCSYPSFEIILVDDASTDHSVEVAERLGKLYPQLKIFKNKENKGVIDTTNQAVRLSKGKYLHFLASDDYRLPGFLEQSMAILRKHPEIPLCCSDHTFIHAEKPAILHSQYSLRTKAPYHLFSPQELRVIFRRSNFWIPGHTAVVKKESCLFYGGFEKKLTYHCDWFLFHHIALRHGVAYLPGKFAVMRYHSASYSAYHGSTDAKESNRILLQFFQDRKELERLFLKTGLMRNIAKVLFFNFLFNPFKWKYLVPLVFKFLETRLAKKMKLNINQYLLNRLNLGIKN